MCRKRICGAEETAQDGAMRNVLCGLVFLFAPLGVAAEAITGEVVVVNAAESTLMLRAADGKTAEYFVGAGDAAIGWQGKTVRGERVKSGKFFRLESIWPADARENKMVAEATAVLQKKVGEKRGSIFLRKGELMPDFALWNQRGELVRAADLRGKKVVLNCVFTRCRNAEMCPRQSTQMAELQRELVAKEIGGVVQVTLTFDPEYDTPGILRAYAGAYKIDGKNYHLPVSVKIYLPQLNYNVDQMTDLIRQQTAAQTDALMRLFGIVTLEEDGTINHNVATLIFGPDGKLLHRRDGPRWTAEEILRRL